MFLYLATSARVHFSVFWITWDDSGTQGHSDSLKITFRTKIDDPQKLPATRGQNPRPATREQNPRHVNETRDNLPILLIVVSNIEQVVEPESNPQSGVTMLNNIVENIQQCGQHNIVQSCFQQPVTTHNFWPWIISREVCEFVYKCVTHGKAYQFVSILPEKW